MANDLNLCTFIGRLGADPEIRYTAEGNAVANYRIACSDSWKDKESGIKQERTEWIGLVAFGRLAEISGEYLKKGSQIYAAGKMRTRKWKDQSGQDRYTTEVVLEKMQMLGGSSGASGQSQDGQGQYPEAQGHQQPQQQSPPQQAPRRSDLNPNGTKKSPHAQQAPHPAPPPGFDDFDDDIPF